MNNARTLKTAATAIIAAALVAVAALAIYTGTMTRRDLAETKDALAAEQATRRQTEDALAAEQATRRQTEDALAAEQATRRNTEDALADEQATRRKTEDALADEQATRRKTEDELQATQRVLQEEQNKRSDIEHQLTDTEGRLAQEINDRLDAQARIDDYQKELATITEERNTLRTNYNRLQASTGTITDLEEEIVRLRAIREPLILDPGGTSRSGFLCTGSMEPKLTCLDEATWLTDFRPEDITIGATISFNPNCWERNGTQARDNIFTAHRVKRIDIRNGIPHYWPKGDNNHQDDGCWIPATDVRGYIVEMHKGTKPENADLRNAVNQAYKELTDFQLRHCSRPTFANCYLDEPYFTQANQVLNHYRCWIRKARNPNSPNC